MTAECDPPRPLVVDVRSRGLRWSCARCTGALHGPVQEGRAHNGSIPRVTRASILYATCRTKASDAKGWRDCWMNNGFSRVPPLQGGLDAWIDAGYPVEDIPVAASTGPAALTPAPNTVGAEFTGGRDEAASSLSGGGGCGGGRAGVVARRLLQARANLGPQLAIDACRVAPGEHAGRGASAHAHALISL